METENGEEAFEDGSFDAGMIIKALRSALRLTEVLRLPLVRDTPAADALYHPQMGPVSLRVFRQARVLSPFFQFRIIVPRKGDKI
jgi:hypothetical protein